jgi:hypothetical protein
MTVSSATAGGGQSGISGLGTGTTFGTGTIERLTDNILGIGGPLGGLGGNGVASGRAGLGAVALF